MNNDLPRVLRFWRDLEIFNIPPAPTGRDNTASIKVTTLRHQRDRWKRLPWQHPDFAPTKDHGYIHTVFVGVGDTEDLARLLLQGLFPERDLSERERERLSGTGWLATFHVSEAGLPQPDSYVVASFAHGVAALRETRSLTNLNARIERGKAEFALRIHRMTDEEAAAAGRPDTTNRAAPNAILDWAQLDAELNSALCLLGDAAKTARLDWRVVVRTQRVRRSDIDKGLQIEPDFLNSFFLDDLDRLIAQSDTSRPFGGALAAYLGTALPEAHRVDILKHHDAMAALVRAGRLPSARWPASTQHPLVLAQQAAVAQVLSSLGESEGLIGINGPPGTGKTTLLCDVVAEIVTARARSIARLDSPADLFDDRIVVASKGFFPLRQDLIAGTSIVVTSMNNNAVKNITQELPARTKIAAEFSAADYFAQVMREVFRAQDVKNEDGEPIETWGAIAAALGNATNRRSFASGFFRDEPASTPAKASQSAPSTQTGATAAKSQPANRQPSSMKQLLEAAWGDYSQHQTEWLAGKQAFIALQAEFDRCRAELEHAETAALRLGDAQAQLNRLSDEALTLVQSIQAQESTLTEHRDHVAAQRDVVEARRSVLEHLHLQAPSGFWHRLAAWFGHVTPQMAAFRQSLTEPVQALNNASNALDKAREAMQIGETALRRLRERHDLIKATQASLRETLDADRQTVQASRDKGIRHFPDARLWAMPSEERHRASVLVYPKLDELRARLFLKAVDLHRLTILANAGKFIANLRAGHAMLTGGSRNQLAMEHRPLVWDALFFVVPVVSTTLASFDRLFVGMGQNSLGWLLIDEAGQATPQSAAGAIWRSRRAVIVGDPLQIEPVFTVPMGVVEELRHHHQVAPEWSPINESVQTLADRVTPFGSWISTRAPENTGDDPERLWTGMPLRTHRRCDDPMFSVANRIAYAGQMVQGRVDRTGRPIPSDFSCVLGESAWFDVRSSRVSHPVCEEEIACLQASLEALQRDGRRNAKIYVVSPFRKVAEACRKAAKRFAGVKCGTVHTFQGKEADIVFLVLGTSPGQAGSGARSWAASKPNLLNVAITRAKSRLFVIGDASQWGTLDHFRELFVALLTRTYSVNEVLLAEGGDLGIEEMTNA